jgi:hypothetical protein
MAGGLSAGRFSRLTSQHLFMFYFASKWLKRIVAEHKIHFVLYAFPDYFQL